MIATLRAYAEAIKLALIGAAALAVLVFYEGVPFLIDGRVDVARKEGAAAEALQWTQRMAALRAKNEADKRATQADIDRIASENLQHEKRVNELDAALEEVVHELETRGDSGGPAVARRLSNILDQVGR